jgi:hypothetical protein
MKPDRNDAPCLPYHLCLRAMLRLGNMHLGQMTQPHQKLDGTGRYWASYRLPMMLQVTSPIIDPTVKAECPRDIAPRLGQLTKIS